MTFQIERLEFQELCAFLRLQAKDSFPDLKNEERLKMLAEKWSTYAECCTCRDEDGALTGMIAFYANDAEADFAFISHVYVSPDYRKEGLFARLFEKVENYVNVKGYSQIKLEVAKDNTIAISAYLKKGFVVDKTASENTNYMIKHIRKM